MGSNPTQFQKQKKFLCYTKQLKFNHIFFNLLGQNLLGMV